MNTQIVTKAQGAIVTSTAGLVGAWLEYERAENEASDHTLRAYRNSLDVFVSWLGSGAGGVTPSTVQAFKDHLKAIYSVQSVNLRLTAVRRFYSWMVTSGRRAHNPASEVKGLKRVKARSHTRVPLSNNEVVGVLTTCHLGTLAGVRDYAVLSLMAFCGLRTVEVHRADIGDLRTRGERLTLDVQGKGRTEKDEFVVIPRDREIAIRGWLSQRVTFKEHGADAPLFVALGNRARGRRLSLQAIRKMVKARYAEAGVVGDRKSTHSLRHSAITNVIRRGATPMQVQSMARHSSFDTTLGYYHETARGDNPAEDLVDYTDGK